MYPGSTLFTFLWFVSMAVMLLATVVFLVSIWRAAKAHESIAESLKEIADNTRPRLNK